MRLQDRGFGALQLPARFELHAGVEQLVGTRQPGIDVVGLLAGRNRLRRRAGLPGVGVRGQLHRNHLAQPAQARAGEQSIERQRAALDRLAIAGDRIRLASGLLVDARAPVVHARAAFVAGTVVDRQLVVAREAGQRLIGLAQQVVRERQAPGGVVGEVALAEVIERGLQIRQALAEAPAVEVEPAGQVLRLGRVARMRERGDDLVVADDRFVVAVDARQCTRAVERRRRRVIAAEQRSRRQQQLRRARVVAAHVVLGHADLIVALGAQRAWQLSRQLGEIVERFGPVSVLAERLGALDALFRRQLGRRRRLGWRCALQRLLGQRVGREAAMNRQELLCGVGRVVCGRQLGQAKAPKRLILERGGAALDQLRVRSAGRRAVAAHPQAVCDPPGRDVVRPTGGLRRRQAIEVLARGSVVAIVELALGEQVQRPVVVAQAVAHHRRQGLDRGVVVARPIGAEPASELGDRRARGCGRGRALRAVGVRERSRAREQGDDQRSDRKSKEGDASGGARSPAKP